MTPAGFLVFWLCGVLEIKRVGLEEGRSRCSAVGRWGCYKGGSTRTASSSCPVFCQELEMSSNHTWAIVLAGGEGERIQPLIERCLGFSCPKQYFTFCGKYSMLENTVGRAVKLAGADRVITVIGSGHRRYIESQRIRGQTLEQPVSRGTGAGVFLPAAYILARDPDATVLILPSDHFLSPRAKFLEQIDLARRCIDDLAERLVLLAAVPDLPETDYGWVEPGDHVPGWGGKGRLPIREVISFREKPCATEAERCFRQGHLWNTMIVATKIQALWRLGKRLLPEVIDRFESFQRILRGNRAERKRQEQSAIEKLYESIPAFDFSSNFLARATSHCAVMPLQGVMWSDWGRPERVIESLRRIGRRPLFLEGSLRWRQNRRLAAGISPPVLAPAPWSS